MRDNNGVSNDGLIDSGARVHKEDSSVYPPGKFGGIPTPRRPSREIIFEILDERPGQFLACHEIVNEAQRRGHYMNENAAATTLCSRLKGKVEGRFREGKKYKEWGVIVGQPTLFPVSAQ